MKEGWKNWAKLFKFSLLIYTLQSVLIKNLDSRLQVLLNVRLILIGWLVTGALPTVNICDSVFFLEQGQNNIWQHGVEKRSWNQLVSASGKEEQGTELRVAKSPVTGNEQTVHFYYKKALWEHLDHIKQELFDDRKASTKCRRIRAPSGAVG